MPCGATSTILVHMAFDENPDPFGLSTLTQSLSWVLGSRFFIHDAPYRLAPLGLWHSTSPAERTPVEPGL